ncbi:MAG: hypothetical protein HZR80_06330 [Candidatus Heimdallarchaeota archaeon]
MFLFVDNNYLLANIIALEVTLEMTTKEEFYSFKKPPIYDILFGIFIVKC